MSSSQPVVLITGASRGVGLATAEELADKGYRVYATVRNAQFSPPIVKENLIFRRLDVTNPDSIEQTIAAIIEKEGRLDVVVNNAAYALGGSLECLTMEEIQKQMDVNFFGVIRVCQAALPHMRRQNSGRIINVSSIGAVSGLPFGSIYNASKAALESLSEALSIEVLPWNIFVSLVEPGYISTKFSIEMGSRTPDQNPYEKIMMALKAYIAERSAHPQRLTPSQSAEEIAQFIHQVIEEENPKLRYQTSEEARKTVMKWLKDPSGDLFMSDRNNFLLE